MLYFQDKRTFISLWLQQVPESALIPEGYCKLLIIAVAYLPQYVYNFGVSIEDSRQQQNLLRMMMIDLDYKL